MECPICTFEFDTEKRKPLLCKCGNSLCLECISLLVAKYNNTYTCPLCKFIQNNYKKSPLPENKSIQKLILKLDSLRSPTKEKGSLTDPLILHESDTQTLPNKIPEDFNEFITITGIFILLCLFLPWVLFIQIITAMIGVSDSMSSCGEFIM